jgi:hypothetical protein
MTIPPYLFNNYKALSCQFGPFRDVQNMLYLGLIGRDIPSSQAFKAGPLNQMADLHNDARLAAPAAKGVLETTSTLPASCDTSTTNTPEMPCIASRLPRFYELPIGERLNAVAQSARLSPQEQTSMGQFGALTRELTDVFIENAVGTFSMPLGVATNFMINGQDVLVPMAVEETSVLAAASHGAKLARKGGGFITSATDPIMTGQVQLFLTEPCDWNSILVTHKQELIVSRS